MSKLSMAYGHRRLTTPSSREAVCSQMLGMGNTCKSMADSCQCMTKTLQYYKVISLQLININRKKKRERGSLVAFPWYPGWLQVLSGQMNVVDVKPGEKTCGFYSGLLGHSLLNPICHEDRETSCLHQQKPSQQLYQLPDVFRATLEMDPSVPVEQPHQVMLCGTKTHNHPGDLSQTCIMGKQAKSLI